MTSLAMPGGAKVSAAYRCALEVIESVEPTVAELLRAELTDQRASLKLIASENYASPAVLLTMGSWLSDKYAEGTIGQRYYAGCENVDALEQLAAHHAKALFGAHHAYVQPHSGSDANLVAMCAVLAARVEAPALDTEGVATVSQLSEQSWESLRRALGEQRMLAMALDAGGHATHGFRTNISGRMFTQHSYGTSPRTGLLDYDEVRRIAHEVRPLILMAGYSGYPRRVNFAIMREIADEVGATLIADMSHFAGLVAGRVFTGDFDPVPHAAIVTTTTHKSLRGPRGGLVLCGPEFADAVDRGSPTVLGGPLPHVIASKAVAFAEARQPAFADYARNVVSNARGLAEGLLKRGVELVTGGTDNHLLLIDVSGFGLTGWQAESALLEAGIVTNRAPIPRDTNGAAYTAVRVGTPALTTRGFGLAEFDRVAELITNVLRATRPAPAGKTRHTLPSTTIHTTRAAVTELLAGHPLYPGLDL
jgi:glycine/serine hydroxymethyltransferase